MKPTPNNPYRHGKPGYAPGVAEPNDVLERAPGLDARQLDSLLVDHYAAGWRKGEAKAKADAQDVAAAAWDEGYRGGYRDGWAGLHNWLWPNVMQRIDNAAQRVQDYRTEGSRSKEKLDVIWNLLSVAGERFWGKQEPE